ncbi:MAG: 16S rRNA (adenine(1518)-N(6)/adenine(1519)-N(6))-dimethyltransferase RsmA [Clostridia bacterium]|nr:16S rRNA (adenine(1518)-N(6)/adenine(1519)-N(6))-dimethyltransferase RsmA [Clostridia bacterium]
MDNKKALKKQMAQNNLHFNKALGQNFLTDDGILDEIIGAACLDDNTNVLEIGPGAGALTLRLAPRAKKVVAVELDTSLIPMLTESLSAYSNTKIINNDILKVDLKNLIDEEFNGEPVRVVANLPYYITTPIIMKLLEENPGFESIIVMVQKEVADRLAAIPGGKNCGAITYSVNYYCEAQKVVDVPPEAFVPAPKVWSSVIKLDLRDNPPVECENVNHLFELIKAAFLMRRKTLLNCISNSNTIKCDKETLKSILSELGISETIRGEALTLTEFAKISNMIIKRQSV